MSEIECPACQGRGTRSRDARDSGLPPVGGYACRRCYGARVVLGPAPDPSLVEGASELLLTVFKYRETCDKVQPLWDRFVRLPVGSPERAEAHTELKIAMKRARDFRDELLKLALAGRSEVPR